MADFAHLHVHSQYSLLEGAIRVKDLCKRTAELGMKAVALTDHNNMHGAIDFYKRAGEAGIKAILGCELACAFPGDKRTDAKGVERPAIHHLVLLAKDLAGYKNLIALVSESWLDPAAVGYAPHTTLEKLAERSKGLVVLSGCLGGLIPQAVLQYSPDAGKNLLGKLRDACEPGSLFVEMQSHGLVEQPIVNKILYDMAKDLGLPVVATNDAHYLRRDDSIAFKLLGCIASGTSLDEANRQDHGSTEMYLKSPEEMAERFRDYPEALTNTMAVVEMISKVDPTSKPMLPKFRDDGGQVIANVDDHFARLAREGLAKRFEKNRKLGVKVDEASYRERLEIEIAVIIKMGFPGYFLIVQDFINWGKTHDVPVGPGRGSGAGSLVAYALGITDLDPIPYNLLFERFLNPERVSMPDFDVDFCMLKRERVIEYVRNKYGMHSVGQIATFQMLKSKSVVRDVGRAMGLPYVEVDAIAKLVPDPVQGKTVTIAEAIEKEPRLKAMYEEGGSTRELLDLAQKLENLNRHAGMHAAGIVISEGPLWSTVPVFRGNNGEIVTQYAKDEVEYAGLVKFDFLGLTTLTVLDIAVQLINKRPDWKARIAQGGEPFDVSALPLDDKPTYALLQSGETTGVFQLESSGMQKLFRDLRPDRFEDIVAAVALYRPGPLGTGMVEDFVARKNGRAKTAYPHDDLKDILQDTYGVITYQEQVMMIARKMGGYTLGGADLLRRAMGKKKPEEMAKQKTIFIEGAKKNGYAEEQASKIFDLLEYFAGYGFNKCLRGLTSILDASTGERTTIEDLFQNWRPFTVHALGDDGKLRPRRVTDVVWNGVRPVFELRTAQGKRIVATGNHPFRTLDGWTNLEDLNVGDRIAAPRRLEVEGGESWPEHEIIVLAGLLSEGNTCHPSSLYFFNNEPAFTADFAQAAARFPHTVVRVSDRGDGRLEVCVNTGRDAVVRDAIVAWRDGTGTDPNDNLAREIHRALPVRSGAYWWAHGLGILGTKADEKRVPAPVFRLRDADLELFLGRLWAGDGFIANATNFTPYYATSSEQFALDVQTLLLRLGILSGVHRKEFKYRGGVRVGYTVHLLGDASIEEFSDRVLPHCIGRDAQVLQLRRHLEATERQRSSKDTVPLEVRDWIDAERSSQGLSWAELAERAGLSDKTVWAPTSDRRGYRRSTVARLAEALASQRLADVAHSDVFWDRIVSIEPRGAEDTYDLTVEDDHNFVADGLIVHNSHSAAYALITYHTAYLKAHYPVEFMCATLTSDLGKIEKVVGTIAEARSMGIAVLPPDVNESDNRFAVIYEPQPQPRPKRPKNKIEEDPYRPRIRFGLGGVKGVGESAVEAILEARGQGGAFKDLFDFTGRVDPRRVNKGVLEALIQSGAFDEGLKRTGASRAQAFAAIEQAIERGRGAAKERASGQMGLFGALEATMPTVGYPNVEAWDGAELLRRERSSLGFYLSGHPLDRYASELGRVTSTQSQALPDLRDGSDVVIAGVVESYRERVPKSGGRMAFFELEDRHGRVEVIVRPKVYAELDAALDKESKQTVQAAYFREGDAIIVTGRVQVERRRDENGELEEVESEEALERKVVLQEVSALGDALKARARAVLVRLRPNLTNDARLKALRAALEAHPGACPVQAHLTLPEGAEVLIALPGALRVDPSEALISKVERIFGEKVAELR